MGDINMRKTIILAALAAATLSLAANAAEEDRYGFYGGAGLAYAKIGTKHNLGSIKLDVSGYGLAAFLGYRVDQVSGEVGFTHYPSPKVTGKANGLSVSADTDPIHSFDVSGAYHVPLGETFEGTLRAGIHRWNEDLTDGVQPFFGASIDGVFGPVTGGLEYRWMRLGSEASLGGYTIKAEPAHVFGVRLNF